MNLEYFCALAEIPGIRHTFTGRLSDLEPDLGLGQLESTLQDRVKSAGFDLQRAVQAEQPHGNRCVAVTKPSGTRIPQVDALATNRPGVCLIVRVADCGPVYFVDPVKKAIALAHSGRKGTEGNIVAATVACLQENYGTDPRDLVVQLGPCIRSCHYEVDFAGTIRRQAHEAGVIHFHDNQTCTACQLDRYYSYRAEKGQTGRMWAFLEVVEEPVNGNSLALRANNFSIS